MSFKKSVKNAIFLVGITIAAILFCVVGVHAATNLNIKFDAKISPDILCSIELSQDGSSYEQYYSYNQPSQNTTGNTLSTFSTTTKVSTQIDFKLKNYTPTKHIRLSIENATINGNPVTVNAEPAICTSYTTQTADSDIMSVALTSTSTASTTITFNLKVEEVFEIQTTGTGLANNGSYYFAPSDNVAIALTPSVGYQLPQNISIKQNQTAITNNVTYSSANTSGNVTIETPVDITNNNTTITCNCEQVFVIKENQAASMFENADKIEYNSTATYLPNNGYYNYTTENETTYLNKENDFKEYKYYVEMGTYPQSEVTDSDTISSLNNATATSTTTHTVLIDNATYTLGVKKVTLNEEEYVGTQTIQKTTTGEENNKVTTISVNKTYSWFKVEPIEWIVIDREDGQSLDALTFKNGMFYTDKLCGKEYTGGLVLMSALTLDAHYFENDDSKLVNFYGSDIHSFLNSSSTTTYTFANNTFTASNTFANAGAGGKYLPTTTLTTTYQTDSGQSTSNKFGNDEPINANVFMLGGNNNGETFWAGKYFKNGVPESNSDMQTYSIGVSAATDFAIAHYCSIGSDTPKLKQGWNVDTALGNKMNIGKYSSAYWTRSYGGSTQAVVVNYQGALAFNDATVSSSVKDSNIGVRPCTILNLGHYYQGNFYGTYSVTNS